MELASIQVKDIVAFKEGLKDKILSGEMNPLEYYRTKKLFTEALEDVAKDSEVMGCAFDEIAKYGKEKPVVQGSVIGSGSKTTYDYSTCGDSVWNELKEKIQEREKYLKALPVEGAVSPETGEAQGSVATEDLSDLLLPVTLFSCHL